MIAESTIVTARNPSSTGRWQAQPKQFRLDCRLPFHNGDRSQQPSFGRLDANMVVYRAPGPLLTAQVSFRRLYGNVVQEKLYLL